MAVSIATTQGDVSFAPVIERLRPVIIDVNGSDRREDQFLLLVARVKL